MKKKTKHKKWYAAVIELKLHPCREAYSKQEFIENLVDEYNNQCDGLFDITKDDIKILKKT